MQGGGGWGGEGGVGFGYWSPLSSQNIPAVFAVFVVTTPLDLDPDND